MSNTRTESQEDADRPAIILGGGVGPLAGVLLHQAIIRNTSDTRSDADHIDVWHIAAVRGLPDRTAYLLGHESKNPAEQMAANVSALGRILAEQHRDWLVAVPCATFHSPQIFDVFLREVKCREGYGGVVHLVQETIHHLLSLPGKPEKIGVLSTKGSRRAGVWREPLKAVGLEAVELDLPSAEELHAAIYDPEYGLKATHAPTQRAEEAVLTASSRLLDRGAQVLVLGCTELPFVGTSIVESYGDTVVVCDPLDILSRQLVLAAGVHAGGVLNGMTK